MFGDEIDISPVHSIEMFSEKYGQLHGYDIDDSKHVGEGHISYDEEESPIDALDPSYGVILTKVDDAKQQGNDNSLSNPNLYYQWFLDDRQPASPHESSELS